MPRTEKTQTKNRTDSVWRRLQKGLKKHNTEVNAISVMIVAGATIILAFLTYRYLKETKSQRLVAQRSIELTKKAFEFESSAQPYIKDIETEWEPDSAKQKLEGRTHIKLANCGRSPASNVKFQRVLIKGTDKQEHTINVIGYLYPGQQPSVSMTPIHIDFSPERMATFEDLKKRGVKIWPQVPNDKQELLRLELELIYDDTKGERKTVPYHFDYNYRLKKWVPAGFGFE